MLAALEVALAERAGYAGRGATTPSVPGAPRDEFPELYVWERGSG
jgi:hypothetical protein